MAPWKLGASWLVRSGMRMGADMLQDLRAGGGGLQLNRPRHTWQTCSWNEAAVGQCGTCEMSMAEEQGMGRRRGGRCGEATAAVLGNGGTALASCE